MGSIVETSQLVEENGNSKTVITLEIKRNYRNHETNEFVCDCIEVTLWNGVAENTVNYCKIGTTIGVKARLKEKEHICSDGSKLKLVEVLGEKITFINTKERE